MNNSAKHYSFTALPEGYVETSKIDLIKDKKAALIVNGLSLVIMAACLCVGCIISPYSIYDLFDDAASSAWWSPLLKCAAFLAAATGYMILHELVHGITMMLFGTKNVKYGFTGMYAYAGSSDFYTKGAYITIALAPIVVWGLVLLGLNLIVPANWFWFVYIIQIVNLSGAVGDIYVTWRFSRLPADILVRDTGTDMTVYAKH